ncbi:MAG TPA: 50S ribosomal protein L11 methyltransferase [Bacillota bacterium]|nr:MAG: Ribosomal protein L11 methyltransferase [Firmicutes bacterium ADurb.Bin153]HNV34519.1 50S ribosomal protein L11 methyltransferase [Bacillota bacterium]HPU95310.1 50S ribosomal protein L11 methyltransferase [Bacillota bacterium]
MRWAEISIDVNCKATEAVASIALEYARGGVAIIDPDLAKDPGGEVALSELELAGIPSEGPAVVRFYVDDDEKELTGILSEIRRRLDEEVNRIPGCREVLGISVRMADEKEWSSWKQTFKPFRLGTRMVVTPTWEAPDALPEDIVIRIDPGQAFGTGQHATTANCAFMLESYIEGGERVLDVGTGTGILSIAAALLGAGDVTAVDIDSTAVKCAQENVALNKVQDKVKVIRGDMLKGIEGPFDIVVANILAEPVMSMSASVFGLLVPGGHFISAGYVEKSEAGVRDSLTGAGFEIADRVQDHDWVCLVARRPVK